MRARAPFLCRPFARFFLAPPQLIVVVVVIFIQVELENWVNSIHNACAAAFARHRGKTGTLHLLQEEIYRLERAIESVSIFAWYFIFAALLRASFQRVVAVDKALSFIRISL